MLVEFLFHAFLLTLFIATRRLKIFYLIANYDVMSSFQFIKKPFYLK